MNFPKTVRVQDALVGDFVDKKVRYRTEQLVGKTYRSWAVPFDTTVEYIHGQDGSWTRRATAGFSLYTETV